MASLLTFRQKRFYVHAVDVYRAKKLGKTAYGGAQDPGWDTTAYATGVPCYRETKPNFDDPYTIGRTDADNLFTVDKFHLPVKWDDGEPDLDMGGDWLLVFHSTGHPEDGMCFKSMGQTQVKTFTANKQSVLAKPIVTPAFLL